MTILISLIRRPKSVSYLQCALLFTLLSVSAGKTEARSTASEPGPPSSIEFAWLLGLTFARLEGTPTELIRAIIETKAMFPAAVVRAT